MKALARRLAEIDAVWLVIDILWDEVIGLRGNDDPPTGLLHYRMTP